MSLLRVGGLASGMDIESIIKDLMKAERIPLDKLKQEKQLLEWKREDYREINKLLFDFREKVFNIKLESTFNAKNATSSDSSVVDVTATSNAVEGIYSINVNSLAEGVSKGSSSELNDERDADGNIKTLSQQFGNLAARDSGSDGIISVTINGEPLDFDIDSDNVYTVVSKINDLDVGVKASYDDELNRFFLTTNETGSDAKIEITNDEANLFSKTFAQGSTTIGTADVVITAAESGEELNGIKFIFNGDSDSTLGVSYNSSTNEFTISGDWDNSTSQAPTWTDIENAINTELQNNGFTTNIELENNGASISDISGTEMIQLSGGRDSLLSLEIDEGIAISGSDASLNFGDATGITSSSNTVTINGITFDLKDEGTSTITVKDDTDSVFETIKDFVESYNEVMDKIYGELQEERYRDYPPLTDEQKEEMTDRQIELWEEKARSGLLRNDPILNRVVSEMRMAIGGIVENLGGSYDSLDDIGITTGSWYENGKLYIDEGKLRDALNKNIDDVKKLFTNNSEITSEQGVAEKIYNAVLTGTELLTDKAGRESSFSLVDNSYISKRIREMDEEIVEWEDRLIQIENRYWRQFTMMEKAINQMNAQSMWLAQQFGGGNM